jgi:hypothetical protein
LHHHHVNRLEHLNPRKPEGEWIGRTKDFQNPDGTLKSAPQIKEEFPVPNLFFAVLPDKPLKFTFFRGVIYLGMLGKANSSLICGADFSVPSGSGVGAKTSKVVGKTIKINYKLGEKLNKLEAKGYKSREDAWVSKDNVIERKFDADSGLSRVHLNPRKPEGEWIGRTKDFHCGNFVVLVASNHLLGIFFFKILICCLPPVPNLFFAVLPDKPLKFTFFRGVNFRSCWWFRGWCWCWSFRGWH